MRERRRRRIAGYRLDGTRAPEVGQGSPVGFISLDAPTEIGLLYVHPAVARQGVGTMLYGALEKLSTSRGTAHLKVDASDTAREFFERKGFTAEQRNSVTVGNEWLSNTTMKKNLAANEDTP